MMSFMVPWISCAYFGSTWILMGQLGWPFDCTSPIFALSSSGMHSWICFKKATASTLLTPLVVLSAKAQKPLISTKEGFHAE